MLDLIRGTTLETESYLDKIRELPGSEQFTMAKRDLTWLRRQAKAARDVNDDAAEPLSQAAARLLADLDEKRART